MSERTEEKIKKVSIFKQIRLTMEYFSKKDLYLKEFAIGMNSDVDMSKDLHILFLDYDKVKLEEVEESVLECQQFWNLSDCFIYKTKNGFHAYFYYDIMPFSRIKMIIDYAKYVDDMFKYISKYYTYKTIRVAGKYKVIDIKFLKSIPGSRIPTDKELELGNMKRKERRFLSNMGSFLQKDNLKGD